ncbi:Metallo-dependent hydrolase [Irpex lacteus]|nr:Metallo-dependent hydrolase [Irpex lacteus]
MSTIFYGALINPVSLTSYDALPHAVLSVSRQTGNIDWVEKDVPASSLQDVLAQHGVVDMSDVELVELKDGEFLMPGFIDTHSHAPQVPNIGSGQEHELLDWLAHTTFPMEARFASDDFARKAYGTVVRRIIDSGTTTCCYYGTLHLGATKILADFVHSAGQRAFVGKCNMDRNSPDYYVEPSASASVADTKSLISHIRSLTSDSTAALVQPVLTPRFAISCTPELLGSLGELAKADSQLTIQTHISENDSEIAFTKNLFPPNILPPDSEAARNKKTTYAGVYDAYGLLRKNTILAHAVHLEDSEVELIKKRNVGISHCPTSNFNLRSGCARVGMFLDKGIKVGLGTDVSGGFSPSILNAVQNASITSKVVAMHHPFPQASATNFASRQLPISTLLYLATQGGADVCDLSARIGSLVPGKAFDALVVSLRSDAGNPNVWGVDWDKELGVLQTSGKTEKELLEAQLERFLFTGDDRNIRRVYVQGRLIGGKEISPSV